MPVNLLHRVMQGDREAYTHRFKFAGHFFRMYGSYEGLGMQRKITMELSAFIKDDEMFNAMVNAMKGTCNEVLAMASLSGDRPPEVKLKAETFHQRYVIDLSSDDEFDCRGGLGEEGNDG